MFVQYPSKFARKKHFGDTDLTKSKSLKIIDDVIIFEPKAKQEALKSGKLIATGLPAGPGAASGKLVFTADDAVKWAEKGEKVLLLRQETSPEDVSGSGPFCDFS